MKKPMPPSTQTEVKISTPIAHKISLGIMMTGAFIALFALIFGLYSETFQKPIKEAPGQVCPDGRISTKCSCGKVVRSPSANYCCSNVYRTTACPALRLWLPFDDNLSDHSGNNNHALCTNPYCPAYAAGHTETPLSATDYSGSQYLTVTNPAALNISGAVTMALWINPASSSRATWQRVIASPLSFTDPYVLSYIAEDNSIAINRRVGSNVLTGMKAVGAVEEGEWQHVAAGYDENNNPFIYINGVKQLLVDAGRSADIIPGDFRIGSRQDGSVSFIGLMDELRIYSKALSQAEINQLAGVLCLPTAEICSDGIDQDCDGSDKICDSCENNAPITTRCLCGGLPFTSGYCCNNVQQPNACTTPVACEATGTGRCFYLAPLTATPAGNDANDGSLEHPWATLGRADDPDTADHHGVKAGDYLYIMGGSYTNAGTFVAFSDHGGTEAKHITIKAYGDSPATFSITPNPEYDAAAFSIYNGADWFTVDGLYNGQRYLIFKGTPNQPTTPIYIEYANHVTIRGVELDGSPVNQAVLCCAGVAAKNNEYFTLEDSFIHDYFLPTGGTPQDPENGQGSPGCVYISAVRLFTIKNNVVKNCNYAGIAVERTLDAPEYGGWYGKITNNFIDARWGGGLHLNGVDYTLVESNVITHAGETTTHFKPTMLLAGRYNSLRNNVIYGPNGMGPNAWGLQIDNEGDGSPNTDNNMIYNNVMFGSNAGSGAIFFSTVGGISMNDNWFFNNIVYHNPCVKPSCPINSITYNYDLVLDWGNASAETDCSTGETYDPRTTHFCGNKFYNNLIRDESTLAGNNGMDNTDLILHFKPGWDIMKWSLNQLQSPPPIGDPEAFKNNIGGDPLLVSEDPDNYPGGLNGDWWHTQAGSPAINKGVFKHDTNIDLVNSAYPGWGWTDRPYLGTAPDIGAYESPAAAAQSQPTNVNSSNVNTNISVPVD